MVATLIIGLGNPLVSDDSVSLWVASELREALAGRQDVHVTLLGIEAQDLVNFGEQCTLAVAAAIPRAVREVLQILESMQGEEVP